MMLAEITPYFFCNFFGAFPCRLCKGEYDQRYISLEILFGLLQLYIPLLWRFSVEGQNSIRHQRFQCFL